MATDLARTGMDEFQPLDAYTGGPSEEAPRISWLATISAGHKVDGKPSASRKGDAKWIHLSPDSADVPGLVAALERGNWRSLTIALPSHNWRDFIQQRWALRSASRVEIYGDEYEIHHITDSGHRVYQRGTQEYGDLAKRCKVEVSVYFLLAEWLDSTHSQPILADGLGLYRLRFTSRNSLREFHAQLREIAGATNGRLRGLPLELTIDWREVPDPKGQRRTIPVWTIRFRPPGGLALNPSTWRELATNSLSQGDALTLPPPRYEGLEDAEQESSVDLDTPSVETVRYIERGGRAEARHWEAAWFAMVKDTSLDSDEARASFLDEYTGGEETSLAGFLAEAPEAAAAALIAAAAATIEAERTAGKTALQSAIYPDEDAPTSVEMGNEREGLFQRLEALIRRAAPLGVPVTPAPATISTETLRVKVQRLTAHLDTPEMKAKEEALRAQPV